MDDYISRAEAINEIMNDMVENATQDDKLYNTGLHRAMSRIDNIPAADVVPVVHGRWIHGREVCPEFVGSVIKNILYENWRCSACEYTIDDRWYSAITYKYCPNCGAIMDREVQE